VLKDLQALSQEHDDAIATLESTKSIFLLHSNEDAWQLLKQHCDEEYTKTTNCLLEGRLPDHLFPDDECHGDHIEEDDRGHDDQEHDGLDEEESKEEEEEDKDKDNEELCDRFIGIKRQNFHGKQPTYVEKNKIASAINSGEATSGEILTMFNIPVQRTNRYAKYVRDHGPYEDMSTSDTGTCGI
jgi:hypothetical protein